MRRAPVIALCHGGGPMPLLGDPAHEDIIHSLRSTVPKILGIGTPNAPRAIIVVTAHWSENVTTISNSKKPQLYYDYYGFPKAAYGLHYDAVGEPDVAHKIQEKLHNLGMKSMLDPDRGWDHGVFVPMLLINPSGSIPVVQMSVLQSESPEDHFRMGEALEQLRDSNIAIIASGFATFHNMRHLSTAASGSYDLRSMNDEWSRYVNQAVGQQLVASRNSAFMKWRSWPGSYDMHPRGRAEHFLPLIIAAGAGGKGHSKSYKDKFLGLDMFSYYWE